jgi:hypothetical protein
VTKQVLNKSLLAIFALLMASTVSKTFAQTTIVVPSHHVLSAGDPGGGQPDPTGDPGPW